MKTSPWARPLIPSKKYRMGLFPSLNKISLPTLFYPDRSAFFTPQLHTPFRAEWTFTATGLFQPTRLPTRPASPPPDQPTHTLPGPTRPATPDPHPARAVVALGPDEKTGKWARDPSEALDFTRVHVRPLPRRGLSCWSAGSCKGWESRSPWAIDWPDEGKRGGGSAGRVQQQCDSH